MSATDLEILNLKREVEKNNYIMIEILEQLKELNMNLKKEEP